MPDHPGRLLALQLGIVLARMPGARGWREQRVKDRGSRMPPVLEFERKGPC